MPFRIISKSAHRPLLIQLHIIDSLYLYYEISCMSVGLFCALPSIPENVGCHILDWIGICQWKAFDCNPVASNLDIQLRNLFELHGVFRPKECTPLAYVHKGHPLQAYLAPFSLTLSFLFPKETSLQLRNIVYSVSTSCNIKYLSPVAVVAYGRYCPGRRLRLPISWNRFHNLEITLQHIPLDFFVLFFRFPVSR